MLIPQRATLFGWAVLFPTLFLLYKARKRLKENKDTKSYFIPAAILGGCLPLIHTHSFMALGLVCTVWLILDLLPKLKTRFVFPLLMVILAILVHINLGENQIEGQTLMYIAVIGILTVLALIIYGIYMNRKKLKPFLPWLIFLGIVLVLAIPQLFGFTFKQANNDGFVRGVLNWNNSTQEYFPFYVMNIGIVFILTFVGFFLAKKEDIKKLAPAILIWFLAELVVFQPNTYDNNKLLLVGYAFMCCFSASLVFDLIERIKMKAIRVGIIAVVVLLATISGVLTLGREYYSDQDFIKSYPPLYSRSSVRLCEYIEENTAPNAVFLTDTNHNNAIASLTGRNIVCGSGTFLYFHGLNYQTQEADVEKMYNTPVQCKDLFTKYHVSYIVLGSSEYNHFPAMDATSLLSMGDIVYEDDEVKLIEISDTK